MSLLVGLGADQQKALRAHCQYRAATGAAVRSKMEAKAQRILSKS
jgi:hypothetical protein